MNDLVVQPSLPGKLSARRSILLNAMCGFAVMTLLLAAVVFWAASSSFSGAVIAHGTLIVSSDAKKIQHPTGGVVREIRVRNGAEVKEGDVLVRLDDTVSAANRALIQKGLAELRIRKARLIAERDDAAQIVWPRREELVAEIAENAMHGEQKLFSTRKAVRDITKDQLKQRNRQTEDELVGLRAQLEAKAEEITLVAAELRGAGDLYKKSLMSVTKYTALQREAVRLGGERGELLATISRAEGKITETNLRIIQIDEDLRAEVGKDLRETEYRINELVERKTAADDQVSRTTIVAPKAGIVHELAVHTVGGVIGPGDVIMLLVPQSEPLMAEVRVQPHDIDQLQVGQGVALRFSAFDQNTTPTYEGTLQQVSADLSSDPRSGASFYLARIDIGQTRLAQSTPLKLLPGMPVEAFMQTRDRTVLSYFTKPLADQIARAFRDS